LNFMRTSLPVFDRCCKNKIVVAHRSVAADALRRGMPGRS